MIALFATYWELVKGWFTNEEGQDLIEYALIIALFVLIAVAGLGALAGPLNNLWGSIAGQLGGG